MSDSRGRLEFRARTAFAERFRQAEHVLYIAVGVALALAGLILFAQVVYTFVHRVVVGHPDLAASLLQGVDGLLLVFIFAELLHTVRVVIAADVLRVEPFLVVGIVAAIRRFIVANAEAVETAGRARFRDLMLELTVLVGAVLVLGFVMWLLRHSQRDSPSKGELDDAGEVLRER
jgi:uncharacterized membrane protein (DUF373 family)